MSTTKWSEDEIILAFYYYCQIPFGKIHHRNPEIIRIAEMLGRTPSAVVFKMGNLAHFDPEQQKRNIKGLSNGSKLDSEVVEEFLNDWETLAQRAHAIEMSLSTTDMNPIQELQSLELPVGGERETIIKARINQDFFRASVMSAYSNQCCITGITNPTLLIASHIKPWAVCDSKTERTNPANGLCLNALHDRAFDQGLITVLPDFRIFVSEKLKGEDSGTLWLKQCAGSKIQLPEKFVPKKEYLEYHNDVVFIR